MSFSQLLCLFAAKCVFSSGTGFDFKSVRYAPNTMKKYQKKKIYYFLDAIFNTLATYSDPAKVWLALEYPYYTFMI